MQHLTNVQKIKLPTTEQNLSGLRNATRLQNHNTFIPFILMDYN